MLALLGEQESLRTNVFSHILHLFVLLSSDSLFYYHFSLKGQSEA